MTQRIVNLPINTPGYFGLNTERESQALDNPFMTETNNTVIDNSGKIASRRGTQRLHTDAFTGRIGAMYSWETSPGVNLLLIAVDLKIYKLVSGTLTDISGTITTPTGNNWQFETFNGQLLAVQANHTPIHLETIGGTFQDLTATGGSVPDGTSMYCGFGRCWMLDGVAGVVHWSGLLDEHQWNTGGSGELDLKLLWEHGYDTAVAIHEYDGHLIIFGSRQTMSFSGADGDPTSNMVKDRVFANMGCIARDSVQSFDEDLFFLSRQGIVSLSREINGHTATNDISHNIHGYLMDPITGAGNTVKSAYFEDQHVYLLSTEERTFAFDTRIRLPDGSYRVTEWDLDPEAFAVQDLNLYIASEKYACTYSGFLDNVPSSGIGGDTYDFSMTSVWQSFESVDEELINILKILKRVKIQMFGGAGLTVQFKWAIDYDETFNTVTLNIPSQTVAEYNIAEYGANGDPLAEYAGSVDFRQLKASLSRSGRTFKFNITTQINGQELSVQRVDVWAKLGKVKL